MSNLLKNILQTHEKICLPLARLCYCVENECLTCDSWFLSKVTDACSIYRSILDFGPMKSHCIVLDRKCALKSTKGTKVCRCGESKSTRNKSRT